MMPLSYNEPIGILNSHLFQIREGIMLHLQTWSNVAGAYFSMPNAINKAKYFMAR